MRVYSPSAEVGPRPQANPLQTGKREVILEIQAVGHYAVQPRFSDGHDSGIFSWDYLYRLGARQTSWAAATARLRRRRRRPRRPMPQPARRLRHH